MNAVIQNYVDRGAADIATKEGIKNLAKAQAEADRRTEQSRYFFRMLERAKALVPADLHPYLTLSEEDANVYGAAFVLALPDCYSIRFQLENQPEAEIKGYRVPGKPFINHNGAYHQLASGTEWELRNRRDDDADRFHNLDQAIAEAYARQQSANSFQEEIDAHNTALRAKTSAVLATMEESCAVIEKERKRQAELDELVAERVEELTGKAAALRMLENGDTQEAIAACLFRLAYVNGAAY